jgi:diguanylate cyclase (GGDEF)-like protein
MANTACYPQNPAVISPNYFPWLVALSIIVAILVAYTAWGLVSRGRMAARMRAYDENLANADRLLQHQATHDALTGLPNRTHFLESLRLAITRVKNGGQPSFAVLFLDLDRFRFINDSLGHDAGDQLLRQISQRLKSELSESDVSGDHGACNVVSRFGGDEFLLLLNNPGNPAAVRRVAERLLKSLSSIHSVLGRDVHCSASVGIVGSEQCCSCPDDVVRNADVAMSEAKRAGRSCCVVFKETMHTEVSRHVQIETSLRQAIGTEQLAVVYQPIVDLSTGELVSAEALVRWQHPTMGSISPAEFIPIAEEAGLIIALDQWVRQEACRAMLSWRHSDPESAPRTVSVNVSRAELARNQAFRVDIQQLLRMVGLPPQCLQLEVTERDVMRNPDEALRLMKDLRVLGVKLAMDDFGTGTSSLGILRSYPFDTIKIDRSFVQGLVGGSDVLAVIHATINLVEHLGMASLVEGIEEEAQVSVLLSIGCRYGQGFLFSKPVPADLLMSSYRRKGGEVPLDESARNYESVGHSARAWPGLVP